MQLQSGIRRTRGKTDIDVLEDVLNDLTKTLQAYGKLQKELQEIVRTVRKRVEKPFVPRVIVHIEGGNYQGASANMYVDLSVLDLDNKKACEEARNKEGLAYYRYLENEVKTLKPLL